MQNDFMTTQLKVQLRTKYYNRLIKIIGKVMGYDDIDCKIEIQGMSTLEASKFVDQIVIRQQAGLISRTAAIARLDRISEEEAREMVKEIEKEEKVKAEQEAKLNKKPDNNQKKGLNNG